MAIGTCTQHGVQQWILTNLVEKGMFIDMSSNIGIKSKATNLLNSHRREQGEGQGQRNGAGYCISLIQCFYHEFKTAFLIHCMLQIGALRVPAEQNKAVVVALRVHCTEIIYFGSDCPDKATYFSFLQLYAEKVATRGLCAIAQAESLRYKLLGGLAVRRWVCFSHIVTISTP